MSIARRRSPGRSRNRACRVAVAFLVLRNLTARSQSPPTDLNAKPQKPKFSTVNSQWVFSRRGAEFAEKKMSAFSACSAPLREMRAWGFWFRLPALCLLRIGVVTFSLMFPGPNHELAQSNDSLYCHFLQLYFHRIATRLMTPNPLPQSHLQHTERRSY
jgi:hypothetical protein